MDRVERRSAFPLVLPTATDETGQPLVSSVRDHGPQFLLDHLDLDLLRVQFVKWDQSCFQLIEYHGIAVRVNICLSCVVCLHVWIGPDFRSCPLGQILVPSEQFGELFEGFEVVVTDLDAQV